MPKPKQKATVLSCCCVLKSISKLIHLTSSDHLASLDYNWAKASGQKSWPGALTSLNMGTIRAVKEVDLGCLFTASPCTETSNSSVDEELRTPAPTLVCFSSTYTGGEIWTENWFDEHLIHDGFYWAMVAKIKPNCNPRLNLTLVFMVVL